MEVKPSFPAAVLYGLKHALWLDTFKSLCKNNGVMENFMKHWLQVRIYKQDYLHTVENCRKGKRLLTSKQVAQCSKIFVATLMAGNSNIYLAHLESSQKNYSLKITGISVTSEILLERTKPQDKEKKTSKFRKD